MDWWTTSCFLLKPVAIYLAALFVVRVTGKRALGQFSFFDFVIMAGIGDIIVVVGLEQQVPFIKGLILLGIVGGLELIFSKLTFKSRRAARLLEGRPTLLIKDGVPIEKNLAREHISSADLLQELRKEGVARVSQVSRAVLEACGQLSVILKEDEEAISNRELLDELASIRQELTELKNMLNPPKEN